MNDTPNHRQQIYRNVMEELVRQELKQQLNSLPPQLRQYINQVEVMTYALNYLPALYASSEKGWYYQISRGKKMEKQITEVVRRALAAVQRDPLRSTNPLLFQEPEECKTALAKLKELLQQEQIFWHNLSDIVEQALVKAAEGKITWKPKRCLPPRGYTWQKQTSGETKPSLSSHQENITP